MNLLSDDQLEQSAIVANCRMNRERDLTGSNGYARDLGFHPLVELKSRLAHGRPVHWLDLCCGTGRALIEAARLIRSEGLAIEIVGVDLVGMFGRLEPDEAQPKLIEASLTTWRPERTFDLITCVHGLHYVGDKLGLIARAASWLTDDGFFVANLDLANFRRADGRPDSRWVSSYLRRVGLAYDRRKRLLSCPGRKDLDSLFRYLGADDRAGPNYTGQPAVNSYYELTKDGPG